MVNFQLLFEQYPAPCLLIATTPNYPVVSVNRLYLDRNHLRKEEVLGKPAAELFHDRAPGKGLITAREIKQSIERVIDTGASDQMKINKYVTRNLAWEHAEELPYCSPLHTPIYDASGMHIQYLLHVIDPVAQSQGQECKDRVIPALLHTMAGLIQAREKRFELMFNAIPDACIGIDHSLRISLFNPAAQQLLKRTPEDVMGIRITHFLPGRLHKPFQHFMSTFMTSSVSQCSSSELANLSVLPLGGSEFPVEFTVSKFGPNHQFAVIMLRKAAINALPVNRNVSQSERLQFVTEAADIGMWDWDVRLNLLTWSDKYQEIFNPPHGQEMRIEYFIAALHNDDKKRIQREIQEALQYQKEYEFEFRILWPDNSIHWLNLRGRVVHDSTGMPVRMGGTIMDITARKANEAATLQKAQFDPLTDLSNRSAFIEKSRQLLSGAQRGKNCVAFLFLDVNRLKLINETHGYQFGDQVLKEISRRLKSCVRGEDIVGRYGSDEFVIAVSHLHDELDAAKVMSCIFQSLNQSYIVHGHALEISFSAGISLYPKDGSTSDILTKKACQAMEQARKYRKEKFQFFREDLNARINESRALKSRLRRALDTQEFTLFFQPIVELATQKIVSAEALIRWPAEKLTPEKFISLAEHSGLMHELSQWVLLQACQIRREWYDAGLPSFPISVNMSKSQLRGKQLANNVLDALNCYQLAPDDISLEFSESSVMENPEASVQTLFDLSAMGIQIALDDYGTGPTSLKYLNQLPLKSIKLDRTVVKNIGEGRRGAVAGAVIALATNFGLDVIAEGVESESAVRFLRTRQCRYGQGYLFSPPVNAEDFVQLLNTATSGQPQRYLSVQ